MPSPTTGSPKLLDRMREKLRVMHYAWKTEKSYVAWIERFLRFHKDRNGGVWRHPTEMGKAEVEEYLTFLGDQLKFARATFGQVPFFPKLRRRTFILANSQ